MQNKMIRNVRKKVANKGEFIENSLKILNIFKLFLLKLIPKKEGV